jgi:hypothetical protein
MAKKKEKKEMVKDWKYLVNYKAIYMLFGTTKMIGVNVFLSTL